MEENTSIMNAFDFTAIEEMDPSLGKWILSSSQLTVTELYMIEKSPSSSEFRTAIPDPKKSVHWKQSRSKSSFWEKMATLSKSELSYAPRMTCSSTMHTTLTTILSKPSKRLKSSWLSTQTTPTFSLKCWTHVSKSLTHSLQSSSCRETGQQDLTSSRTWNTSLLNFWVATSKLVQKRQLDNRLLIDTMQWNLNLPSCRRDSRTSTQSWRSRTLACFCSCRRHLLMAQWWGALTLRWWNN